MKISDYALTDLICRKYIKSGVVEEDFTQFPRPYFSIAYVDKGIFDCTGGNVTFSARQGDAVFIPYHARYKNCWHGDPETILYSCHFNFPAFSVPFGNKQFHLQRLPDMVRFREDFTYLARYEGMADQSLEILRRFYEICCWIYPRLTWDGAINVDSRIRRVIDYLNANYTMPVSVGDLARICHMSDSRFYYCFKRETGMTPIAYKNSVCIRHAALALLSEVDKSIEEVSSEMGFMSSAYFRRVFKLYTGQTPREYRKMLL